MITSRLAHYPSVTEARLSIPLLPGVALRLVAESYNVRFSRARRLQAELLLACPNHGCGAHGYVLAEVRLAEVPR